MTNEPISKESRQASRKRTHADRLSRYQRVPDAASIENVGINTLRKIAAEAHALIHLYGVTLVDMEMLYKHIEKSRTSPKNN